ncbi:MULTISPECIES: hypothetical protein [unclassified Arthrobacter]|uniref:hypothetical protein n=1 Tax=unclassified Arthrobacter TaxID=235627 RepID=UPI001E41A925|nr:MULTISPECIES: hypothetical protein [unclassified Arthrobacter]MCC9145650.1 hypothetical protein [Arthrobacter sp. zg-Y919]MDK1276879.1 hypothetical protein [Arthrobacter sp. zg.Y919]WIB04187.1 hypothetical protein QNO10_05920 [Arthrobacter sp. zg-Y919]
MQQLEAFLLTRYGVASYGTLTANGFPRRTVDQAVRTGMVRRVARGTFALPQADARLVDAARNRASSTCVSAAHLLGWWVLTPPVTAHVRCDAARSIPGAVVHRGQRSAHRLIAPPQQILRDAFRCLPRLDALVMAESAVITNAVGLQSLQKEFSRQQDWPVRALLGTIRRTTASPLEVCARFHLLNAGLRVETEVLLPGIGRADLLVDGWLIVEIDGFAFHSSREHYRMDRRRWNASSAAGWITLRITAELVLHRPDEFVDLVKKTRDTWGHRLRQQPQYQGSSSGPAAATAAAAGVTEGLDPPKNPGGHRNTG